MKTFVNALLLSFAAVVSSFAQDGCPTVRVWSPAEATSQTPITYSADVSGGDRNVSPTYNWTVSASTISGGQGTSSITVETLGANTENITATVDVGGFPRQCRTSASATTAIKADPVASKLDEYGKITTGAEKARLDNFMIELQNNPVSQAFVIGYGGRQSTPGQVAKAFARVRKYLTQIRMLDGSRITFTDGGYKEEATTELWIAPPGAAAPTPSPTVDPSEVIMPKKKTPVKRNVKKKV